MSEQTPETPAPTAPEAQEQPTQDVNSLPEWARSSLEKANREAATYRTKLREVEPLAAKARELEEAQQTEAERIAARATAAERERDEARAEGLRYKAAARNGISEDYFDLLGAGDEEAINTRAERLGGLLKATAEIEQLKAELEALRAGRPAPTSGRPTAALKPGATPESLTNEDAEFAAYAAALNLPFPS